MAVQVGHMPSGMPGSLPWIAARIGIPASQLASMAAGDHGHLGRQARFYKAMENHRRMRQLALIAAGQNQPVQ